MNVVILLETHRITNRYLEQEACSREGLEKTLHDFAVPHSFILWFQKSSPVCTHRSGNMWDKVNPRIFKGWQLSGLLAHPIHHLQTFANSLGSSNHYYHAWKPYCRTRMGNCGDRESGANITEPVYGAPLSFPRSTLTAKSALQSGPGCAHLVIVFVDILVEFVQSHTCPKVTRVVLGKRANKGGEK